MKITNLQDEMIIEGTREEIEQYVKDKLIPAMDRQWYSDSARSCVMFPRTVDPNAPTPPKPPSSLPKAAPDLPTVTRTGTAKAGAQKARLVPCVKSKFHGHHPEGEECPNCDPPARLKGGGEDPEVKRMADYIFNAFAKYTAVPWYSAPAPGGLTLPPVAPPPAPVPAAVPPTASTPAVPPAVAARRSADWYCDPSGTWFDHNTGPVPPGAKKISMMRPGSLGAKIACGCSSGGPHTQYVGRWGGTIVSVCACPGIVDSRRFRRVP